MPYTPLPQGGGEDGGDETTFSAQGTPGGSAEEIRIYRRQRRKTDTMGYTVAEVEIDQSPAYAHVYWSGINTPALRDEAHPGVATIDRRIICRFLTDNIGVQIGDVIMRADDSRLLVIDRRLIYGVVHCYCEQGAI